MAELIVGALIALAFTSFYALATFAFIGWNGFSRQGAQQLFAGLKRRQRMTVALGVVAVFMSTMAFMTVGNQIVQLAAVLLGGVGLVAWIFPIATRITAMNFGEDE